MMMKTMKTNSIGLIEVLPVILRRLIDIDLIYSIVHVRLLVERDHHVGFDFLPIDIVFEHWQTSKK